MKFAGRQGNLRGSEIDVIRTCKKLGFDGVQLGLTPNYEGCGVWWEPDAEAAGHVAREEGVEVCSFCAGALNKYGFVAEDEAVRGLAQLIMEHSLRAANALGASNVLLPAFGTMKVEGQAGMDRVADEIRKLLPLAEQLNMVIAFECTLNAADTLAVCDATGSDLVQVYFDMGNAYYYGYESVAEAEALAQRIAEVHIKDATREAIVPLGKGDVDVAAAIKTLSECGYDGYYAFETKLEGDPEEALARDLAYTRELISA